jgi:alkylation response protein AidB-like acyl-CoA dehydrogenase
VTALLDAHLTAEQIDLLDTTARAARERLTVAADAGAPGGVNRELMAGLASTGLLDRLFRRQGDGWAPDVGAMELCLIREGLARHCTEAETAFAVQGLGSFPLLQSGRAELVATWAPRLATGEAVAAFALTEPQSGSDVAALALAARRVGDGDGFVLSGEKVYLSNAPDADAYSVFARTTEGAGARGLTAFWVPRDTPGLRGERIELISPHPIGRLIFEDVRVAPEQVLGEVDAGFRVAMRTLDLFRASVGAFAVGMAQAAIAAARDHAASREAFGRPLKDFQGISHRLADVATRVQAARLLVHHAATAYDRGLRPVTQTAAMAKLMATEVAQDAVDLAVQVHGARALERGHLLEHLYREVRAPRIYEGASEIQREIIARALFATVGEDQR